MTAWLLARQHPPSYGTKPALSLPSMPRERGEGELRTLRRVCRETERAEYLLHLTPRPESSTTRPHDGTMTRPQHEFRLNPRPNTEGRAHHRQGPSIPECQTRRRLDEGRGVTTTRTSTHTAINPPPESRHLKMLSRLEPKAADMRPARHDWKHSAQDPEHRSQSGTDVIKMAGTKAGRLPIQHQPKMPRPTPMLAWSQARQKSAEPGPYASKAANSAPLSAQSRSQSPTSISRLSGPKPGRVPAAPVEI